MYIVRPHQEDEATTTTNANKSPKNSPVVEIAAHAIHDSSSYINLCERPKESWPAAERMLAGVGEHLMTVFVRECERGEGGEYKGSTPPAGYPNSWGGAVKCESDLTLLKGGGIDQWDRAYDAAGNQVN